LLANPTVTKIVVVKKEDDEKITIGKKGKHVRLKTKYTHVGYMDKAVERANYGIIKGKMWDANDKYQYHDERMYAYGAKEYEAKLIEEKKTQDDEVPERADC
jgi:hypothetical protein